MATPKYSQRTIINALLVLALICTSLMVYFVFQNQELRAEVALLRERNLNKQNEKSEAQKENGSPTKKIKLEKTINSTTYQIKNSSNQFGNYNFGTIASDSGQFREYPSRSFRSTLTSMIQPNVSDFWVEPVVNMFFLVTRYPYSDGFETITQTTIADNNDSIDHSLLYSEQQGIYTGSSIEAYYPSRNQLLMHTDGGDGCGGWGEMWLLNLNGVKQSLFEFSSGCVTDQYRFGKKIGNKLIVAEVAEIQGEFPYGYITNLYEIDIFTQARTQLAFTPPEGIKYDLRDATFYKNNSNYHIQPPLQENEVLLREISSDNSRETEYAAYNIETQEFRPVEIVTPNN